MIFKVPFSHRDKNEILFFHFVSIASNRFDLETSGFESFGYAVIGCGRVTKWSILVVRSYTDKN